MFVKFKYVMIALVAMGVLGLGGVVLFGGDAAFLACSGDDDSPPPAPDRIAEVPEVESPRPRGVVGDPNQGGTNADKRAIEAANAKAQPNSKKKDALEGKGWKINLYEETGDDHYDRAKIDRDRDETWDEKWSWKEGRWEKDEGALIWKGGAWVDPKAASDKEDAPKAPSGDRDTAMADIAKRVLTEKAPDKKAKDFTSGAGPKVNLYDDDGDGKWDRGKVDVDRDDTWDQKWTIKGGVLERKIEATGEVSVFNQGAWVPKK